MRESSARALAAHTRIYRSTKAKQQEVGRVRRKNGVYKKYSLLYRKIVQQVVLDTSDFHISDSENESVIH